MAIDILVVDDDNDDLALFIEALNIVSPDAVCQTAVNGSGAIEYLSKSGSRHPAIIFLDINMPVMNGWDCMSFLKSNPLYKDIPVIIYTTSSTTADKEKARAMSAFCFISKMQDFRSLKKMVEIVVRNLEKNAPHLICPELHRMAET